LLQHFFAVRPALAGAAGTLVADFVANRPYGLVKSRYGAAVNDDVRTRLDGLKIGRAPHARPESKYLLDLWPDIACSGLGNFRGGRRGLRVSCKDQTQ
jgi:hypothetical protein